MANVTRADIVFLALHEACIGLAAGLGGAVATAVIVAYIEPLVGLFDSILYTLLAGLAGMIGGVVVVGYRYVRAHKQNRNFRKQLLQAVLGMAVGVGAFCGVLWLSNSFYPSNALINLAVVLLPLLGLLISFNHRIRYE
jgi:GNAT superfamily N-acetyltransferase